MSLKHFHIVFIAASLSLFGFLLYWTNGHAERQALQTTAVLGLLGGVYYLKWFLGKYRRLA